VGTVVQFEEDTTVGPLQICQQARRGLRELKDLSGEKRSELLRRVSKVLLDKADVILEANEKDLEYAKQTNLDPHMLARLKLSKAKLETLSKGINDISNQPDPIGQVVAAREITEGLVLRQETVPLGVLMVIFESRPDALPQVVALGLRSGNPLILKGGKEAAHTNACLLGLIHEVIAPEVGAYTYQLVASREDVASLMGMNNYIDLVIPRGSNQMVQSIQNSTKIPVMGHADGICHVYVDKLADLDKAKEIVVDSKTDYPAACNAMETLLIHEDLLSSGKASELVKAAQASNVKFYAGPRAQKDLSELGLEPTSSLGHEYGSLEAMVEVVSNMEEAVDWITKYGSAHTESIVTEDKEAAETFLKQVDSADVFHNSSTRFADGYRYGLGAEVGISTSRIHARGPVGVQGLLTTKWVMRSQSKHTVAQFNKGLWAYTHKPMAVTESQ
jgi:delta-1-pyrroline-5-carboxylate synthetase